NALPGGRINRMCDIAVFTVCRLAARHRDEKALLALDHLNIMYYKLLIDRDGYDRFHLSFFCYFPYSYICYIHGKFPPFSASYASCQITYLSFFSITILMPSSPQ